MKMKINNENERYTFCFMFSYEYSTYQIIKNPYNGKCQHNISSYGETRNITQDYYHEENFKNLQTHYILKTLWYITWIFRRKIIENYPRLSYVDYLIEYM